MRSERTRRAFVAAASTFLAGLAGCQAPATGPSTPTTTREAQPCRDAERTADRPPTDEDHPLVREYPQFPDEITRESAGEYAITFEEAYQLNRLASKSSTSEYQVTAVYNRESSEVEDGFVVSFETSLSWQRDSVGTAVLADDTVPVTYFVSSRTAIRHEGSTDYDPRNDDDGEVVACHRSG